MIRPCKVCGSTSGPPQHGQRTPLCWDCDREWWESKERLAAAQAREDFIARRRTEREPTGG
jgi:hypothetical protein